MSRKVKSVKAAVRKRDKLIRRGGSRLVMPSVRYSKEFKQIVELFFKPLIKPPEEEGTYMEQINRIFGSNFRQIITFISTTRFVMPGTAIFCENPEKAKRMINVGDLLLIRTDVRTPNKIDVEHIKTAQVFQLTATQYAYILEKIERMTPCAEQIMEKIYSQG